MGGKKLCWVSWDDICKLKSDGGLGVKEVNKFNKALLAKWMWKFLLEKRALRVRIIKGKARPIENVL